MIDFIRENSYPTPLANSSFLPLMVLSLAKQKNSPSPTQTPSTILPAYDFIIVGAGSGGSVVASRLSELECVNVLLIEAGKAPPIINDVPAFGRSFWFSDIDWKFKTVPQSHTARLLIDRQLNWPSGKAIGGSSILNAMLYVRGNKRNYDDWAAQGAEGWSYKDVLPYFKKLEDNRNLHYILNGYQGVGGPITVETPDYKSKIKYSILKAVKDMGYKVLDSNGAWQTGFYDPQTNTRHGQRCSMAKGYLVPAEKRKNLHILPNAFVHKILIQNKTAVGVLFENNGTIYEVKAKREVIMSAGATNTAQLLMLSGIGPKEELEKHGIPIVSDLPVGYNLQDHVSAILNYEMNSNIRLVSQKLTDPKNIMEYINLRKGILTVPELVLVMAFLNNSYIRPKVDDPNFELYFVEASTEIPKTQYGLTEAAYKQIYAPHENKPFYQCLAQILQPKSRGFVRLQSSDPRDAPLIDPNYFADPEDLNDIVEGMKVCQRIGKSKAMRKIGSKSFPTAYPGCEEFIKSEIEYLKCQAKSVIITMSHQVGTAKMGSKTDNSTVVDTKLRVKGIKSLRVVDASIMPIIPSGNTNIVVCMIAEKASHIIQKNIRC